MNAIAQTLSEDQSRAEEEIIAAQAPGDRHLLTGYAGSGKTTLIKALVKRWRKAKKRVAAVAPTHQAVSVIAEKLAEDGITGVDCRTLHSLLSLKAQAHGDRQIFERDKRADPVLADVVVIDEGSMVGSDMMVHVSRHLPVSFVLFSGDPAQLPPIGERESEVFQTKSRSHLSTILRYGGPILDLATAIRESQERDRPDWSWLRRGNDAGKGVYVPGDMHAWLKQGFTSKEFEANPNAFRYLCYRNDRVAEVNAMIRAWRYGGAPETPFVPGEWAMFRQPLFRDSVQLFSTNEEALVLDVKRGTYRFRVDEADGCPEWVAEGPAWKITVQARGGDKVVVDMPVDERSVVAVENRIKDEASVARVRWRHFHDFRSSLAKLQAIYAMTVHRSQGSTFKRVFVDVDDIGWRMEANPLETKQMLYVAATRPTDALMLVNVPGRILAQAARPAAAAA